jgi:hypothetical protein
MRSCRSLDVALANLTKEFAVIVVEVEFFVESLLMQLVPFASTRLLSQERPQKIGPADQCGHESRRHLIGEGDKTAQPVCQHHQQ